MSAETISQSRTAALERLVWRYGKTLPIEQNGLPTGFAALDRALPQRGWFADALNELLGNEQGAGEFSLLLPSLKQVCADGKGVVLVNPPFLPYAPALDAAGLLFAHLIVVRHADSEKLYWAAEQALRSKACGAVVVWSDESARPLPDLTLRRLQIAAHAGSCAGFLFRPLRARERASPAPLRIVYAPARGELELTVHKCRGLSGIACGRVQPWRHAWATRPLPATSPAFMRPLPAPSPALTANDRVLPRQRPPSPHNSGDPCINAGCIEAGAGPWRGFAMRNFAKSHQEQR
jgi:hypothetical protein